MPNFNIFNKQPQSNKTQIYANNAGTVVAIASDADGTLHVQQYDSAGRATNLPLTSFKDLRVAEIQPVTGYTCHYGINSDLLKVTTQETGTVYVSNSKGVLETTTATPTTVISAKMETIKALRYQSGIGAQVRFTAIFTQGVENSQQIIGIGDEDDGYFFGYNGGEFGILRRRGGTDTWVSKSNWNGDKLDGTGDSGVVLDTTKGNVYVIQYQWLGFGVITFWIANPSTGDFILVHTIQYPNNYTDPSVYNPTLPLMAKVEKTSGASNIKLQTANGVGIIEGPIDHQAIVTRNSIAGSAVVGTTETNVISIKNMDTFQGKNNRVRIKLDYLSVSTEGGSKTVTIRLVKNANLGSPTWTAINANTSVISYNTTASISPGSGTRVLTFELGKTDSTQLFMGSLNIELEPGSTFTVSAITAGSDTDVDVALSWTELW